MDAPNRLDLIARLQLLVRVFADRLQHHEAELAIRVALPPQQAVSQQSSNALQHVLRAVFGAEDRGDCVQPCAAREDRQAPEEGALLLREQPITPGNRIPQGLLPVRQVARTAREQTETACEPGEQGCGWQRRDPRRRELDGQWQAVQSGADCRHCGRVLVGEREVGAHRLRPLDEEGDRRGGATYPAWDARQCPAMPAAGRDRPIRRAGGAPPGSSRGR